MGPVFFASRAKSALSLVRLLAQGAGLMTIGRDEVNAALSSSHGAGSQRLQTLASEALERACVAYWCDPLAIVLGLGRDVRAVTRAEGRASLVGDCVDYSWVPGEPRETDLNVFMGAALVVFADAGVTNPSPGNVSRVAGYLALPDPNMSPELELALQTHAPIWFLREHQKRRRWDKWSDSGVFAAVSR